MSDLIERFRERKLVQWGLAYFAGGWLFLELLEFVAGNFGWPVGLVRGATVVVGAGFLATLVFAWYHGEMGRQRVSGPELLIIAGVAALCALVLTGLRSRGPDTTTIASETVIDEATGQSDGSAAPDAASDAMRERAGRVLVFPLENVTGDPELDPLGRVASSWIERQLTQTDVATVVPFENVTGDDAATAGSDAVAVTAGRANAELVVTGEIYRRGDDLEVAVQIVDPLAGRVVYTLDPARDDAADPMGAFETLGQRVVGALAVHYDREWSRPELYTPPPSLEAYQLDQRASEHFSRSEYQEALDLRLQAWERDTTWLGAISSVPATYFNLRRYREADSVATFLEARRERLSPQELAGVQWIRGWIDGDLELEYRAAQRGVRLDPIGWAYAAAVTASRTNRLEEALEHLSRRDLETDWGQSWVSWDYVHLNVLMRLGRFEEALEVTRMARRAHPERTRLLSREAYCLAALGRTEDLFALYEEAKSHPASADGTWSPGSPMNSAAYVFHAVNRPEDARRFGELALEAFDQSEGDTRYGLARALFYADRPGAAETILAELSNEEPEDMVRLGWHGAVLARLGRTEEAHAIRDRLGTMQVEYFRHGYRLFYQSWISVQLGELDTALDQVARAVDTGFPFNLYWTMWATFHGELRNDPRYQRLVAPKG